MPPELHVLAYETAQHDQGGGQRFVEVEHLGVDGLAPCEGQQVLGELRAACGSLQDVLEILVDASVGGEAQEDHLGASLDHAQHVVEVMRNPACQAPQR